MEERVIFNEEDSCGDIYCKKYDRYVPHDVYPELTEDTLRQLESNYEVAIGGIPSAQDMMNTLSFIAMFCAELMETAPKSIKARAAGELYSLIDEDNPIKTAMNIAYYREK
jgi:hypothetical protein